LLYSGLCDHHVLENKHRAETTADPIDEVRTWQTECSHCEKYVPIIVGIYTSC